MLTHLSNLVSNLVEEEISLWQRRMAIHRLRKLCLRLPVNPAGNKELLADIVLHIYLVTIVPVTLCRCEAKTTTKKKKKKKKRKITLKGSI